MNRNWLFLLLVNLTACAGQQATSNSQTAAQTTGDTNNALHCDLANGGYENCKLLKSGELLSEQKIDVKFIFSYKMSCFKSSFAVLPSNFYFQLDGHQYALNFADKSGKFEGAWAVAGKGPLTFGDSNPKSTSDTTLHGNPCQLSLSYSVVPSDGKVTEWASMSKAIRKGADYALVNASLRTELAAWFDSFIADPDKKGAEIALKVADKPDCSKLPNLESAQSCERDNALTDQLNEMRKSVPIALLQKPMTKKEREDFIDIEKLKVMNVVDEADIQLNDYKKQAQDLIREMDPWEFAQKEAYSALISNLK